LKIKIKKLRPEAKIPTYAYKGDAAMDLYSLEDVALKPGARHGFSLGFAAELPKGYVALVWDRSSFGAKGIKSLGGVIDPGYRGEWRVFLQNVSNREYRINKGDKIAQVLIQRVEEVKIEEVNEFSISQRGENGFGSSGK